MRALRWAVVVMIVAGGCLTGRSVYMHGKAAVASVLIRRAWEESVRTGEAQRPWQSADMYPVARLRIPRLGYDEIVLHAALPRALAFGPARVLSGAEVGEAGNVVLAGHRDSWFAPLEGIEKGDVIEVEWRDARGGGLRTRRYVVEMMRVVAPDDLELLGPTRGDALTLWTCYPFGRSPRSPQRYVVRATPVG